MICYHSNNSGTKMSSNKFILKSALGVIAVTAIVVVLPKSVSLADYSSTVGSINGAPIGYNYNYWTHIGPDPYPEWWNPVGQYAPVTISITVGVGGNFGGTDQMSIDCSGGNNYTQNGSGSASFVGDVFNVYPGYWDYNQVTFQCSYTSGGTYSPHIHVIRTGSGGCPLYEGRWSYPACLPSSVTATTDYYLPSFTILQRSYLLNIWPNSQSPYVGTAPQSVGFTVQAWQSNGYCPPGANCNFSVSGYFTYHVNCGDGSPVKTVSGYAGGSTYVNTVTYNSRYQSIGSSGQWVSNAFSTGAVCNYQSPGVYQVSIGVDGISNNTVDGGTTVTLLPSGPPSVTVSANPTTGDTPLNNVAITANISNLMPSAYDGWGSVEVDLRCDGNLPLEQDLAAGVNPGAAASVYGSDGQISNSYFFNFNSVPLVSSTSTTMSCSYSVGGTHTPTVVVTQNSITAAGGTKVYAVGELKCDGTDVLKAPADYRLDWNTLNTNHCTAGSNWSSLPISQLPQNFWNLGGANGLGFSGMQSASGTRIFYNVEPGNYIYNLDCVNSGGTQHVTSTCAVKVTP